MKNLFGDRFIEFFEDEAKMMSLMRLTLYGAFVTASAIMLILTVNSKMTEGYFDAYLAAFVTNHILGKAIDNRTFGNKVDSAVPPPDNKQAQ